MKITINITTENGLTIVDSKDDILAEIVDGYYSFYSSDGFVMEIPEDGCEYIQDGEIDVYLFNNMRIEISDEEIEISDEE